MPDMVIVGSFLAQLQPFASLFTARTFRTFQVLACGWVLALGRHTVTMAVRAANATQWKHIRSFHRFFSKARWGLDQLGLMLVRRIDLRVTKDLPLVVALDDTLGRRTGKTVAFASMHRDPLRSTKVRPVFSWGHLWVVLGITVRLFDKIFCLPVFFRLYRSKKVRARYKTTYRTMPELGAELVALVAKAVPHRALVVLGDGAYSNHLLVEHRPANVTVVGRSRLDAAIYAAPPPRQPGQMGRPRVRGVKLPAPGLQADAKGAPWQSLEVFVYGRTVSVNAVGLPQVLRQLCTGPVGPIQATRQRSKANPLDDLCHKRPTDPRGRSERSADSKAFKSLVAPSREPTSHRTLVHQQIGRDL
ncbi:uncharacterized protein CMC5_058370 [Chondromyces crocatus]|uniref:Transposase IS701-like DDE domain-containing protein n=1 Tax=Chondromyces crocatus TaxID=52 RepID=A0A0K1EL77_CHOCO|nr:uncharacterized protein CMC5_058370 [Chondromyces crocatus]